MSKKKEDILSKYGKDITEEEWEDEWKVTPRGIGARPSNYHLLFRAFAESTKRRLEIDLDAFPEPRHREKTPKNRLTTKQDACYSSFQSWKAKGEIKKLLNKLDDHIKIRKTGKDRIALYKEPKEET